MISSKKFVNDKTYRKHHFQTATGDRPLIAQFCGDNAAMIAMVGLEKFKNKNDRKKKYNSPNEIISKYIIK